MPERIRLVVLKIAFALITMGNSVVLMGWNKDRIVLYLGLATLLSGIFFEVIKETDKKVVIREIIFCGVLIVLLSIGIAVQDLYLKKKIVLIASVGILAIIATMSHHMVKDIKSIYSCSIGIFIGIVITFLITLLIKRSGLVQNANGTAITCGMEHKNFFGVAVFSILIGAYLNLCYNKKEKSSIALVLLSIILIILSRSRATMIMAIMFLIIINIYKILPKVNKKIKIVMGIFLTIAIIAIVLNLNKIENYRYRIIGLKYTFEKMSENPKDMIFGVAGKVHTNDNYVYNVRNYLDWNGTPEMSIVAILIKGGLCAMLAYFILFARYIILIIKSKDIHMKYQLGAVLFTFILSMVVETYVMNINLVYCPFSYCIMSCLGIIILEKI